MNFRMMGKFLAQILLVEAVFMLPAAVVSLIYGEATGVYSFLAAMGLIALVSGGLFLLCKGAPSAFYA